MKGDRGEVKGDRGEVMGRRGEGRGRRGRGERRAGEGGVGCVPVPVTCTTCCPFCVRCTGRENPWSACLSAQLKTRCEDCDPAHSVPTHLALVHVPRALVEVREGSE